jgi:predicted cupin superfamily sugar epimerase
MLGIDSNTLPQCIIPAATWFAAEPIEESYSLVGCVVAPGFEFEDFELAARADLLQAYPAHADLITRFTVDAPG